MSVPRRLLARRAALLIGATFTPLLLWSSLPLGASGANQSQVESQISKSKAREGQLRTAAEKLAKLERVARSGVLVLRRQQETAQAELSAWETKLARTEGRLGTARQRLASQQRRVRVDRRVLSANLRGAYVRGRPDLLSVVIEADDFADLVDRVRYETDARQRNAQTLKRVRRARVVTLRLERNLTGVALDQREQTAAVRRERDAVAQRTAALAEREQMLAQARAARLQALSSTRSGRRRAERTLARLVAAQQHASVDKAGPGGPWAIPWAIVRCESGGQNLPPNSAGASGYYQFMPATWRGMGGSTPQAYQAGKAEQDRLAAKLWNGGAGARNWVCASIVGII